MNLSNNNNLWRCYVIVIRHANLNKKENKGKKPGLPTYAFFKTVINGQNV